MLVYQRVYLAGGFKHFVCSIIYGIIMAGGWWFGTWLDYFFPYIGE
jgi:hypothetical protein